jgi:putative transposase
METYLLSCGRYIERNRVEAGMVAVPWEYRWSSCRAYALGEVDPLLSDNPHYRECSSEPGRRQARWRQFLTEADPNEAQVRDATWVLGEEAFRRRVAMQAGRPVPRPPATPDRGFFGKMVT